MDAKDKETGKPILGKHLIIFLNGQPVHSYWREKDLAAVVENITKAQLYRHGLFELHDGRGAKAWLEAAMIDGWMIKDIEPNMAQVIVAAINQENPTKDPSEFWKEGQDPDKPGGS